MMASGLARGMASRNKNVAVQEFHMGLDFSNVPTRARLAEGSYIAVQIPEGEQWTYNPVSGQWSALPTRDKPCATTTWSSG
jgi:hypothetical protein